MKRKVHSARQGFTKSIWTVALLLLTVSINSQIRTMSIPDKVFEQYLVSNNYDEDLTINGIFKYLPTKVNAVTSLDISNKKITDLTGIEVFKGLTNLNISNNNLGYLDVSKNTKLIRLNCNSNQLVNLNLTTNTALTNLSCAGNNRLTTADLRNGTNNIITALDIKNNPSLICIFVDNVPYSNTKWGDNKDATSNFVANKQQCESFGIDDNFNPNKSKDITIKYLSEDEFSIVTNPKEIVKVVAVYDILGRKRYASNRQEVYKFHFSNGIYLLKIRTDKRLIVKKIAK